MAISLETWLAWAGRDQAWYDALTPAQRKRVQASMRNTSSDRTKQSISITTVEEVAQEVDLIPASERQRERADAESRARGEAQRESAVEWASRYGERYDAEWFDGLTPEGKRAVIEASVEAPGTKSRAHYWNRGLEAISNAERLRDEAAPSTPAADEAASAGDFRRADAGDTDPAAAAAVAQADTAPLDLTPEQILALQRVVPNIDQILLESQVRLRPDGKPDPDAHLKRLAGNAPPANTVVVQRLLNEVLTTWTEEQIKEYQQRLVDAGFLSQSDYAEGDPGGTTLLAITTAISNAQLQKVSLEELLEERKLSIGAAKGKHEAQRLKEMAEDQYRQQLVALHTKLWGMPPNVGWIESAMGGAYGTNIYEIEFTERNKPAFQRSPRYQNERIGLEAEIAQTLGSLGGGFSWRGGWG